MKTIYLIGEIGYDVTAKKFREKVNFSSNEKLRIIINSPGGFVSDGIEIFNMIKMYKGEVEIVLGSMVASAASYIAMAVPAEKRKAFQNSSMMIHEASAGVYGKAKDFKNKYERLTAINSIIADGYVEGLGIEKEKVLNMMSDDYYMTGWEQLTNHNVIGDIIDPSEVLPPDEKDFPVDMWDLFFAELQKEPDPLIMKEKMYATEERILKDTEKANADFEKAAALLKNFNPETPEENNKIKQEGDMTLQEFIKSNPEAKAEYDKALESAKADGIKEASAPMQADRERIAKILKIAKAELSKEVVEAIEKDTEPGDFAIAQADAEKSRQQASNAKPTIFGDLVSKQTPEEQTANAQDAGVISVNDYEEKARSAFKKKEAK